MDESIEQFDPPGVISTLMMVGWHGSWNSTPSDEGWHHEMTSCYEAECIPCDPKQDTPVMARVRETHRVPMGRYVA